MRERISESQQNVDKSKRGISIFENKTFTDPIKVDNLPLLDKKVLGGELEHYLNLQVAHKTLDNTEKNEYGQRKELVKLIYKNPSKKAIMEKQRAKLLDQMNQSHSVLDSVVPTSV